MNEQQQADDLLTSELAAKRTTREELKRDLERLEVVARQNLPPTPPPQQEKPERRYRWPRG